VKRIVVVCVGAGLAIVSAVASAHTVGRTGVSETGIGDWFATVVPLLLAALLYARGLRNLRKRVGWRQIGFAGGLLVLTLALLSPLDRWSAELFAWHMVQHEALLLIAAPLLVLGAPLPIFLWGLPARWRSGVVFAVQRPAVRRSWRFLLHPASACLFHAGALWLWHAPALFNAALLNRGIHDIQHLSFLISALVFWAALFEQRARDQQGAAILYLFVTTVHSSVLGALITFAARPWYSAYLQTPYHWTLSALEDQQLGGLIMWVPGSMVYVGAALALLARWIMASESRQPRHDARAGT
jgi:putative membrane protein